LYASLLLRVFVYIFYIENPSLWKDGHPACGGAHQSPIDISTCDVIGANVSRLTFINYDKIFPETVTNNGFTSKSDSIVYIVQTPITDFFLKMSHD
jgi:hypothetical protein